MDHPTLNDAMVRLTDATAHYLVGRASIERDIMKTDAERVMGVVGNAVCDALRHALVQIPRLSVPQPPYNRAQRRAAQRNWRTRSSSYTSKNARPTYQGLLDSPTSSG